MERQNSPTIDWADEVISMYLSYQWSAVYPSNNHPDVNDVEVMDMIANNDDELFYPQPPTPPTPSPPPSPPPPL